MALRFYCPEGHLLETDESQIGQQCMCPYCQSVFLVPEIPRATPIQPPPAFQPANRQPPPEPPPVGRRMPAFGPPVVQQAATEGPQFSFPPHDEVAAESDAPFPAIQTERPTAPGDRASSQPAEPPQPPQPELPAIVHILCPSGHELETPREMLDQDALCPYCQVQFLLRYEDSLEYQRERAEQLRRRQEAVAKAWMRWSIAAAVLVVLGVITMIVMAARM